MSNRLCLIVLAAIFILTTAGFVIILRQGPNNNQSVGETIYQQFEYVLTIITLQGNKECIRIILTN